MLHFDRIMRKEPSSGIKEDMKASVTEPSSEKKQLQRSEKKKSGEIRLAASDDGSFIAIDPPPGSASSRTRSRSGLSRESSRTGLGESASASASASSDSTDR